MVKDGEQFASKDKERKELAEARNQADHAIYATEKALRDYADKVSAADKEKIEKSVEALKKVKEGDKVDEIKRAIEEVNKTTHEFSKALYEEAAKKQGSAQTGTSSDVPPPQKPAGKGEGDEKIIDADFKTK
jgi:molecular chaperone DnaK